VKVAVSIPDDVFRAAEDAARRLRVPRSQFYAKAVLALVKQQENPDVTRKLDRVYGSRTAVDRALVDYARRKLRGVEWEE
jgi:hypothetical protein